MRLRWRYVPICVVPFLALHCGHSKQNSESAVLAARWAALTSGSAEATMALRSDWGSGYCADVSIVNRGSTQITGWTVVLDLRQSAINQIWNGTLSGTSVTPASHNKAIAPGGSVNFGFCANATGNPYLPTIASMSVTGGDNGGGTGGSGGSPGAGGSVATGKGGTPGAGGSGGTPQGGAGAGGMTAGKGGTVGAGGTGGTTTGKGGTPGAGGTTSGVTGASIRFDSDWGSGYCATVSLQGSGAWTVVLNLNGSQINNLWNGTYTTSGSNATVQGNQASFGFCALSAQSSFRASIVSVNGNPNNGGGKGGATGSGGTVGNGGSGGMGKGGTTNGAGGSGGKAAGGATSGSGGSPPIQTGCSGYATRFWDCCKPHCGWSGNVPSGVNPMNSCSANDQTLSGYGQASSCNGGSAFTCYSLAPYAVNSQLAYGYAATSNGDVCGRCYQLQFDGRSHNAGNDPGSAALAGKTMIVQAINVGFDVSGGQFDLLVPGGGVGAFNACSTQWGVSNSELGVQYGGFLAACKQQLGYNASLAQYKSCVASRCQSVFGSRGLTELQAGCQWFVDWFQAADNPSLKYKEVACPSALSSGTGMNRSSRNDISNACGN
ncbi:MAG: cellulose binding domain-containing protein [Myxococcota bacterium]